MTHDDLDAISFASVNIDEGSSTEIEGEVEGIDVSFTITKAAWLSALASSDDAAILVSWIDARRNA